MEIWTTKEEARRLAERFQSVNQAEFARTHRVPGGASMVSQHIKGRRPISMEAAVAYSVGFGVPLSEISPRLANQALRANATVAPSTEPGAWPLERLRESVWRSLTERQRALLEDVMMAKLRELQAEEEFNERPAGLRQKQRLLGTK